MSGTYSEYVLLRKGPAPPGDPHEAGVRVYADEDGVLRVIQSDGTDEAIGGGGAAFNGGTITQALGIIPTDNNICLDVEPTATSGSQGIVSIAQNQDLDTGDPLAVRIKPSGGSYADVLRVNANGKTRVKSALAGSDPFAVDLFGGTSAMRVNGTEGSLVLAAISAPASGDVGSSECALWVDDTNGAAGLQLKAKTANGTVRTSSYPLRQTSGALSTINLTSGVASQVSTHFDAQTVTRVAFDPGVATTAECLVELSPNDGTYTSLGSEIVPAGTALDGTIRLINVLVPAGWYLRLTCNAQAGIISTVYY